MIGIELDQIVLGGGLLAIGLTVFAESGLLVGFFLPGDTLLLGAGILASQGTLPFGWLVGVVIAAAIIGDNVGYSIGRRAGPRIFKKRDGIIFRHEYLERAKTFYSAHGGKTIVLARFVPIVRTFAPVVAGASHMPRRRFMLFNVVGGVLWGGGVTALGYWFGSLVPGFKQYIEPVFVLVMLASFGLAGFHLLKDKETRSLVKNKLARVGRLFILNKKID